MESVHLSVIYNLYKFFPEQLMPLAGLFLEILNTKFNFLKNELKAIFVKNVKR